MKKFYLFLTFMLVTLTMSANKYFGELTVTVNEEPTSQDATISITENDGKYTLSVKNFILAGEIPVGNIILRDIEATEDGEYKEISFKNTILLEPGDDPNIPEDEWMALLLNEVGGVPVDMVARFNDLNVKCHIDIDMTSTIEQVIEVDFRSYPTTAYNGTLTVTVNEEPNSQNAQIKIANNDGKYTLCVTNFILGGEIPVGDIILKNLEPTDDAAGNHNITYSGTIMLEAGEDPNIPEDEWMALLLNEVGGVPVNMTATFNDTDLNCHIDIDMTSSLEQVIEVDFTTDSGNAKHGDVNGDGILDVADVVSLANHVMGETPEGFNVNVANINGDEIIDVADVVALANSIMGS